MALILCIETSSTNCSVALANEAYFLNHGTLCMDLLEDNSNDYSHGERLHTYIDQLLKRNNYTPNDLDAIAVSQGPGSYTGLRIGVASVKGMCYALNIPMIAVCTLESLSSQIRLDAGYCIPMLDARRMEVYTAVYKDGVCLSQPQAMVLDTASYTTYRNTASVTFIGTGVDKFKEIIDTANHRFITTSPTARTMCSIAVQKYKKSDTVDVAYFEPYYLKEFKAGK